MSTAAAKVRALIAALILAGLLTVTLSALPATAAPTQVTATAGVNIRSGPSTSSSIVGGLYRGQTVTAISDSGGWTKIRFAGRFAYIASRYLTTRKLSAPASVTGSRITTTDVNLRSRPSLASRVLWVVPEGTRVRLTGGSARGFVAVTIGKRTGWISTQYLARSVSGLPTIIGTRVATANLSIRTSSGANARVVGEVKRGTRLSVTGTTQNGRAQIIYRQAIRWVTARYLSNTSVNQPTAPSLPRTVGTRYATTDLNVWVAATGSSRIAEVSRGEAVRITGVQRSGRAQVVYDNAVRWLTARYLSTTRPSSSTPTSPPSSWGSTEDRLTAKTISVHRRLRAEFPQIRTVYGWRQASSGEHPLGRALDVMIPNYQSSKGQALGTDIAEWVRTNAGSLDLEYVIWRQQIWNPRRAGEGWRFMADRGSDSANHINHVHISVRA